MPSIGRTWADTQRGRDSCNYYIGRVETGGGRVGRGWHGGKVRGGGGVKGAEVIANGRDNEGH